MPSLVFFSALLASTAFAAPSPTVPEVNAPGRPIPRDLGLLGGLGEVVGNVPNALLSILPPDGKIHNAAQLSDVITGIAEDINEGEQILSAYALVLQNIIPSATPTSIPDAISIAASVYPTPASAYPDPGRIVHNVGEAILNSLSPEDLTQNVIGGYTTGVNDDSNSHPPPPTTIYPRKDESDAPYSVAEDSLRGAIYIPAEFEYGRNGKQPVILTPGTAAYGGLTYSSNYIKLLSGTDYADPVWLNIPGALLGDAQVNSEYVAYAINYISSVSQNSNVSVIAWSQGNLDTQWALKYWPSTRSVVSDFIGISPDFHGTVVAYLLCPGFPDIPCDPSVLQQTYDSNFVSTLRSNGGDSAYVPTTTIYSIFDEIVQPQANPDASGFINDARSVGTSNTQLQAVCPGLPAGGPYTHEGVLFNPIAFALAVDALTHDGPGDINRIDLATECNKIAADGLSLTDVLATEGVIAAATINLLLYFPKLFDEPAIMSYAA